MKRKIIIGSMLGAFAIMVLSGFYLNRYMQIRRQCISTLHRISRGNADYQDTVTAGDELFGDAFEGDYEYTDSQYTYMIDPLDQFVTGIFHISQEDDGIARDGGFFLNSQNAVVELFESNMSQFLQGDTLCELSSGVGQGMTVYTLTEVIKGIETGTTASIIIDEENKMLLAATFVKGDPERVVQLNSAEFISEEKALELALAEIKARDSEVADIEPNFDNSRCGKAVHTFKGQTFWYLQFDAVITFSDGTQEITYYEVSIDVINGEILEIAEMV